MKVLQLGNGGGLNPAITNSSFLINYTTNSYMLFDCGHNIMERLLKPDLEDIIPKISHVFISHIHDDHIGNIGALIYYRFFKLGLETTVLFANDDVKAYLELMNYNSILIGSKEVVRHLVKLHHIQSGIKNIDNLTIQSTLAFHGTTSSNGAIIYSPDRNKAVYISGDTKAHEDIENEVSSYFNEVKPFSKICFHDYSYWNAPSKNPHACESDFTAEYSEKFRNQLIKYHTGDDFNSKWITV